MATVSEHNGDMGAYAFCELFVAGESADFADAMWIDAGDAVTWALTWTSEAQQSPPCTRRASSIPADRGRTPARRTGTRRP
jgi:hypothetical protein